MEISWRQKRRHRIYSGDIPYTVLYSSVWKLFFLTHLTWHVVPWKRMNPRILGPAVGQVSSYTQVAVDMGWKSYLTPTWQWVLEEIEHLWTVGRIDNDGQWPVTMMDDRNVALSFEASACRKISVPCLTPKFPASQHRSEAGRPGVWGNPGDLTSPGNGGLNTFCPVSTPWTRKTGTLW